MTHQPTRRRVLQATGVGATASLAGCSQFGLSGDGSNGDELEAEPDPDIDPEDGITAVVQPPQEELADVEREVAADVEDGDIGQMEAQAVIQERQQELFVSRSVEFESEVADDDELSIEGAIGEQGAFLLDASEERLIAALRNAEVDALLPGEDYGEALEAMQESAPEESVEPAPDDDTDAEDEDG